MKAIQEFFAMILVVITILVVLGFGFYVVDETLKEGNRKTNCTTYQYYTSIDDPTTTSNQKLERMYATPYTICK